MRVSLGRTMVEWYPYLDRWWLKIRHWCSEGVYVCMQVRFSLPESERLELLYKYRGKGAISGSGLNPQMV